MIDVGVIGYGAIGKRHVEIVNGNRRYKLVAVCDIRPIEIENKGVKVYNDYREMIQTDEIDLVVVCTPNHLHMEMTIAALQVGRHVLCEKPLALRGRDCKRMIHTALKEKRFLFCVKQNRYNPPVVEVLRLINSGRLGRIYSMAVNCYWNRDERYYWESDWKGTKDKDGGILFTQFSHFIDILCLVADSDVTSVYAAAGNYHHPYMEIDDAGALVVRFENGIIGNVSYTVNAYGKNMEGSVTIFAERGTVKIGGQYLNEIEYQSGTEIRNVDMGRKPNDYGFYQGSMSNHDLVYADVAEVIEGSRRMPLSAVEAMRVTELIEAAQRSVETGKVVVVS